MQKLGAGSKKLYLLSSWLVPVMPLGIAFLSWINSLNSKTPWLHNRTLLLEVLTKVQGESDYIYFVLWLVFFISVCYKHLGDPWAAEKLQFVLDRYQNGAFNKGEIPHGAPKDHNRVTLFRHQRIFAWWKIKHWSCKAWAPWGDHGAFDHYLVPVMRSGHLSQQSKALFWVSDESDKTEGIAGRAWSTGQAVDVANLPSITRTTKPRTMQRYADQTFCPADMVRAYAQGNRPTPRSVVAIPVERYGKLWGVVVLDSRYEQGVSRRAVEEYQMTVALIGHLLEKVS